MKKIIECFYELTANISEDPEIYFKKALLFIIVVLIVTFFIRFIKIVCEIIKNKNIQKNGVLLKILVKKTASADKTEALIRNIHSVLLNTRYREILHGRPWLSFEIAAEKDKISFYIWVPKDYKDLLIERIYATYPECAIMETEDYLKNRVWINIQDWIRYFKESKEIRKIPKNNISIFGTEVELAYHHIFSLNKNLDQEDIISSLLSGMKNLEWHEKAVIQILVRPVNNTWQKEGRKILENFELKGIKPSRNGSNGVFNTGLFANIADEFSEEMSKQFKSIGATRRVSTRKTRSERGEIGVATEKILDAGFETVLRVCTIGHYKKGSRARLKILSAAFSEMDKVNKFKRRIIYNHKYFYKKLKNRSIHLFERKNILTSGELSKFFLRLPDENIIDINPEIEALIIKEFAPPKNIETEKNIIGVNTYRGKATPIGLKENDLRRHLVIEGKTGTGKSEWAKGFMIDRIKQGDGLALLDPHGKLSTETICLIPPERRNDVVVFDLFDDYPPPFNFCKVKKIKGRKEEETIEKTAKEIIDINKRLFSDAWSGKNAYYLENAIKTVIELKNGNYIDIRRLFSDKKFREYAIKNIKDPQLKHFWKEEFKTNNRGELPTGTQSTVNSVDYKLGSFLNSKSLLRAIGQDDCIDFKEILDKNKIIIFKFDKERMSEDQIGFIGGIALKLLIVDAFQRDKKMWNNPFMIVIDEAQNFLDANIKTVLYELRKYGVCLVPMHQALEQMEKVKGLTDAIYGSVGTNITFTVGKPDAPFFEKIFEPRIDQKDLIRLPSRYGYVKLMVDGQTSEAFNIYTIDSPKVSYEEGSKSFTEILLNNRQGRKHYKEIDKEISERMGGNIENINDDYYEEIEEDNTHWEVKKEIAATGIKGSENQEKDTVDPQIIKIKDLMKNKSSDINNKKPLKKHIDQETGEIIEDKNKKVTLWDEVED